MSSALSKWKKENPEFGPILARLESDMVDVDHVDKNSLNIFAFLEG
jgi:hypothetical protein